MPVWDALKDQCTVHSEIFKATVFAEFLQQTEEKECLSMEERIKCPLEERLREHIVGQEGPILVVGSGELKAMNFIIGEWMVIIDN